MKWYKSMFGHICRNNVLLSTSDSSFSYLYSIVLVLLNIPGTVKGQHTGGLKDSVVIIVHPTCNWWIGCYTRVQIPSRPPLFQWRNNG